jgi:hypothetical protein
VSRIGGGNDLYSDRLTDRVVADTPNTDGSKGETLLIDSQKVNDFGTDQYLMQSSGIAARDTTGAVADAEAHNNRDGGMEDVIAGDKGVVTTAETKPDGSTAAATDNFQDSSNDLSHYSDSDVETPGPTLFDGDGHIVPVGGSPIEEEVFTTHDDDTDKFQTGDKANVVVTATAPTGAVTKVTITDQASDGGTAKAQDDETDNETLPTKTTGETDDWKFNPSASEKDTAIDNEKIVVQVDGLVAAGDQVDSTETITLGDTTKTEDAISDPGTEHDSFPSSTSAATAGEAESDKFTENLKVGDDLKIDDHLVGGETISGADGSVKYTYTDDHLTDHLTDQETDQNTDQHTATVPTASAGFGPLPETDTDHDTVNDKSVLKNVAGDILNGFSFAWTPVTTANSAGALTRIGSLLTVGSIADNFGDTINDTGTDVGSSDTTSSPGGGVTVTPPGGSPIPLVPIPAGVLTDNFSDDMQDQTQTRGYSVFNTIDPTTGVQTNIIAGDVGQGTFNDQSSDNSTGLPGNVAFSASGSGSTGNTPGAPPYSDTAKDNTSSTFSDRGPLDINVQGSPQAGETMNVGADLILSDSGQAGDNGQDTSTAPGSDSGGVNFQSSGDASVGGRTNATMTNNVSTNDGKGNTVNSTDTLTDNGTVGAMDHNDDGGLETFTDSNGQPATDTEGDTDHANALAQSADKLTDRFNGTFVSVDPTTGLKTTMSVTDSANATETTMVTDTGTDVHGQSGTTAPTSSDDVTFDDKATQGGQASDSETIKVTTQGTDTQGEQVNIQETISLNGTATNSSSDEDAGEDGVLASGASTGGDTETVHADVQANVGMTDSISGTVVSINSATGVTTTTSDNITISTSGDQHEHEDETDARVAGSPDSDTANQTDSTSATTNWNASQTVTSTNADGSVAAGPTTTTDGGNDALAASVGLALAADGTVTKSASGSHTGSDSSSDPSVGTISWSNQPVDQTSLDQMSASATLMLTRGGASTVTGTATPTAQSTSSTPTLFSAEQSSPPAGSVMGGGGWNPLNWPGMVAFPLFKSIADGYYGLWTSDQAVRNMERQREAALQQDNSVENDEARAIMRERNMKPVPQSYNDLIQNTEVATAGIYGSRPGGVTPNPRAATISGAGASAANAAERNAVTAASNARIGAKTWQSYQAGIRRLYGESSLKARTYRVVVDGKLVEGVADDVAVIGGKNVAIEAKFCDDWAVSLRNPDSPIGKLEFAVKEQQEMLAQAKKYSAAFPKVVYHSNSQGLIAYYSKLFLDAGLTNIEFVLTP